MEVTKEISWVLEYLPVLRTIKTCETQIGGQCLMLQNFRSGGRPVLATNVLARTGALNIMVCYCLSSGQPFFKFSLSPLILSMILSMTS